MRGRSRDGWAREDWYELREKQFLKFAVLANLEVSGRQICNDASLLIRDDGVDSNAVGGDSEPRSVFLW